MIQNLVFSAGGQDSGTKASQTGAPPWTPSVLIAQEAFDELVAPSQACSFKVYGLGYLGMRRTSPPDVRSKGKGVEQRKLIAAKSSRVPKCPLFFCEAGIPVAFSNHSPPAYLPCGIFPSRILARDTKLWKVETGKPQTPYALSPKPQTLRHKM